VAGYPLVRLREDHKRAYGTALHIAPLGFSNLVEYAQFTPFVTRMVLTAPDIRGEKG
jgi:hypothetical protein